MTGEADHGLAREERAEEGAMSVSKPASKERTRLLLATLLLLLAGWLLYQRLPDRAAPRPEPVPPNRLRLEAQLEVPLYEPEELDGWTRDEVLAWRAARVALHPELVDGSYIPSRTTFGQIADEAPWWGIEGQFCHGPGERSIEGAAEEARFLGNPFLLLGLGEAFARIGLEPCLPVWPRPLSLTYAGRKVTVRYDLARLLAEKEGIGKKRRAQLFLHNYNARDWGYGWVMALQGSGVAPTDKPKMFLEPVTMQAYLHRGSSCGYPGGCNNGSPKEPLLYVRVMEPPAWIELGLWRSEPAEGQEPDLLYRIEFQ